MCAYVANQKYQVVYKGRCQSGFEIKSISECSAAAKFVDAPDTSVSSDGNHGSKIDPPFCYYKKGKMKFNAGNNKGICQSSQLSVCMCVAPPYTTTQPYTTSPFNTSYFGAFPWWDGYMHCFTLDELSR